MDASHTIQSVQEGHVTWIRTDGRMLKKKKEENDTSWNEKGWKAWYFLGFNEQLSMNINTYR